MVKADFCLNDRIMAHFVVKGKIYLRIGKFYHFCRFIFVNFFAFFTLDFMWQIVVKCCCIWEFPFFTNFKSKKGAVQWNNQQKYLFAQKTTKKEEG